MAYHLIIYYCINIFTICSNKLSALIWETGCQFMENLSNCQFSIRCLTVWCVQPTDLPGRFGSSKTVVPIAALVLPCSTHVISTFSTPCLNSKSFLHVVNHVFLPHESNLISEVALWNVRHPKIKQAGTFTRFSTVREASKSSCTTKERNASKRYANVTREAWKNYLRHTVVSRDFADRFYIGIFQIPSGLEEFAQRQ